MQLWYNSLFASINVALFFSLAMPSNTGKYATRIYAFREYVRRTTFGKLPIVIYNGYAFWRPSVFKCVSSIPKINGTIVAPSGSVPYEDKIA